jgi:cobalamin synthase
MFEEQNAHNLERIADALEVFGNLYLVYLYAAFGAEHIDALIDTITEGEEE